MTAAAMPARPGTAWCCAALPALVVPAAIALVDNRWLWLVPVATVAIVVLVDECMPARRLLVAAPAGMSRVDSSLSWGDAWLALYGIGMGIFLLAGQMVISGDPPIFQVLSITLVLSLLFSVAYNVAHDLIHRVAHPPRWIGGHSLLALVGDAQLSVSHVYSHHPNVATDDDPASARLGESLYRFVIRSTRGQYAAAWNFETRRLRQAGRPVLSWRNRVLWGSAATVLLAAAFLLAFGPAAAFSYLTACVVGKFLFESANYIQHYGLRRRAGEKVGPQHSWDCLAPLSRLFMFNQNHHADHHLRAASRCWELGPTNNAPLMPHGYLLMLGLCTIPPLWFRKMNPRACVAAQAPSNTHVAGAS